jgi:hypothetical protein
MEETQPFDPYKPPVAPPKLTAAEATDARFREISLFVLLNVATCGIYWFYIAYEWAREVNGLVNRAKHPPVVVLLVSLITCGVGGLVYEILFAADIAAAAEARGVADRRPDLQTWVIGLNVAAFTISMIPFGFILGLPLGIWASVMIQQELNKLAVTHG